MCFFVWLVYLVMEFVEASVVMIKGKATGKYIAMSANGELYTTVGNNCLLLKTPFPSNLKPLSQSEPCEVLVPLYGIEISCLASVKERLKVNSEIVIELYLNPEGAHHP